MKFSCKATVNYPDDKQDTPTFTGHTIDGVCSLLRGLLEAEGDALSSCVITIAKEQSND